MVGDQIQHLFLGGSAVDLTQELQPLHVGVALLVLAHDLAVKDFDAAHGVVMPLRLRVVRHMAATRPCFMNSPGGQYRTPVGSPQLAATQTPVRPRLSWSVLASPARRESASPAFSARPASPALRCAPTLKKANSSRLRMSRSQSTAKSDVNPAALSEKHPTHDRSRTRTLRP